MNRLLQQQSMLGGLAYSMDLSRFPASAAQRRVAAIAAGVPLALSALFFPITAHHGPTFAGFIPAFNAAILVVYFITAYLLYRQYRDGISPALLVLACAYLFNALIVLAQLLSYPHVFGAQGLFDARRETSAWLWITWHTSFPLFVIAYVALDRRDVKSPTVPKTGAVVALAAFGTLGAAAFCAFAAFRLTEYLPATLAAGSFAPMNRDGIGPAILIVNAAALSYVWFATKGRNVIHLWLVVAVMTMLLDAALSQTAGQRYSVGWYASRGYSFAASLVLLGALLNESSKLGTLISSAERQLRTVVAGVADALIAVDKHGYITWLNPAARTLFGYTSQEAAHLKIDELFVDPSDRPPVDGGPFETLARNSIGDRFPIEASFGAAPDEGRIATIMIARDITQRKLAETEIANARDRALEAAKMKATFLATMSHEIRTPINAVIGMAELLAESRLTGEEREFAETIRDSADALLGVVNDILDFSKLEAGKIDLDVAAFEPRTTIETAAEMLAVSARRKGLTLLTYVAPDVPETLIGDEHRLRQVLLNLTGNAIKFTERGNVVVRAFVERTDGEETVLQITVTDTGIGLSQADAERLFTPFTQADGSTSRRFGGTGLGLSISKGLVEAMGGSIGVQSRHGDGSTFTFSARFTRVSVDVGDARRSTLRGLRCLVVDADAISRQIVRQYLLSWGMVGTVAADSSAAMNALDGALARGVPYDVAIVDGTVTDTASFAQQLAADPAHGATKIVYIAAVDRLTAMRTDGPQRFRATVHKPLRQSSLFDAIAVAADRLQLAHDDDSAAQPVPVRDDVSILLVEDNPVNQRVALQQLKRLGYAAQAVGDGLAAVEATARERYSLVLMDCQMPDVDGFEATRRIRAAERGLRRHTPIVAMTAGALEGDREECLAAGMDDYLSKPVQLAVLQSVIERWTANKDTVVAR